MNANKTAKSKGSFPKLVTVRGISGISARIYRQKRRIKNAVYTAYILSYSLLGKRRLESHAKLDDAQQAGEQAIKRIAEGQQSVLQLSNHDREQYVRAKEVLAPLGLDLDVAALECAEVRGILAGAASPAEAARYFIKTHSKECPRISVPQAVNACLIACRKEKSKGRMGQLENHLNRFAKDISIEVGELSPGIVSAWLTAMVASETTKKNAKDILGFFGRWLVMRGYLPRGTDITENVQRYSSKVSEIQIFTPAEISKLLEFANDKLLPYLAIGAFAGLRAAEIQRLDWTEVDLKDGFIEVTAAKSKTNVRRLVPVKPCLAAWLKDYRKRSGPVCTFKNVRRELRGLIASIPAKDKLKWKKNGLRHSCISYRVAESGDLARVADESGNSPAIIRSNYLRRVKPDMAKAWFNVMPVAAAGEKILKLA